MPEFGFTEVHELLREQAREFAKKELLPGFKERSVSDRIPRDIATKIAGAGYIGIMAPEKYGGQGLDAVSMGIVMEEFGKVDRVVTHTVSFPAELISILIEEGSEEQKQEWIPPALRGELMPGFCFTEPECGTDLRAIKLKVVREGDFYITSGEKTSVTCGMEANPLLVWGKTKPEAGVRGISCFIMSSDLPGIAKIPIPDMGLSPFQRASIHFDAVRFPARSLLGGEGEGVFLAMGVFDVFRTTACMAAIGQAEVSLSEAIDYAKQRVAFGRPVAKFEAISFKIAEDLTLVDAARLLCYRTLWMRDQGLKSSKEAAMCKWLIPQLANKIIHDSLLIFGHYGYSQELPLQQRLSDNIAMEIGDGTAEAQKLVIVREALGREFLPYYDRR